MSTNDGTNDMPLTKSRIVFSSTWRSPFSPPCCQFEGLRAGVAAREVLVVLELYMFMLELGKSTICCRTARVFFMARDGVSFIVRTCMAGAAKSRKLLFLRAQGSRTTYDITCFLITAAACHSE